MVSGIFLLGCKKRERFKLEYDLMALTKL